MLSNCKITNAAKNVIDFWFLKKLLGVSIVKIHVRKLKSITFFALFSVSAYRNWMQILQLDA